MRIDDPPPHKHGAGDKTDHRDEDDSSHRQAATRCMARAGHNGSSEGEQSRHPNANNAHTMSVFAHARPGLGASWAAAATGYPRLWRPGGVENRDTFSSSGRNFHQRKHLTPFRRISTGTDRLEKRSLLLAEKELAQRRH